MPRLTKRVVDAALPKAAKYFIWCSELHGFGVRIFPSGKAVFYVDYYNKAHIRRRMTIGAHGKITCEEARDLAIANLGSVVRGEDPANERATGRKALTVGELCDKYLATAERGLLLNKRGHPKKASTLYTDRGRILRHIVPLLGTKRLRNLEAADIHKFIRDVADGKTAVIEKTANKRGRARVTGGLGTATRTVALLSGILTFAVHEGIRTDNPCRGVQRPAGQRRQRRLSADEYAALGQALDDESFPVAAIVRLLALSGCRLSEIVKLRWVEVDREQYCLRLADSKTGPSVRPLGKPALAVLAQIARTGDFVFPAVKRGHGAFGGIARGWHRLMKHAGLQGVTLHTLRHSYASVADELGFTLPTIRALLGHAIGGVTEGYIHKVDTALVAAADKVAATISGYLKAPPRGGRPPVPDDDMLMTMAFIHVQDGKPIREAARMVARSAPKSSHSQKAVAERLRKKYPGQKSAKLEAAIRQIPQFDDDEPDWWNYIV